MTTKNKLPISKIIITIWNKYKNMPYDAENPDELDELIAMVADISENTIIEMINKEK